MDRRTRKHNLHDGMSNYRRYWTNFS
jgi:hypothetical protein